MIKRVDIQSEGLEGSSVMTTAALHSRLERLSERTEHCVGRGLRLRPHDPFSTLRQIRTSVLAVCEDEALAASAPEVEPGSLAWAMLWPWYVFAATLEMVQLGVATRAAAMMRILEEAEAVEIELRLARRTQTRYEPR